MLITALSVTVAGSAFALFRDSESIPGNTISTGTVDIALSNGMGQFPSPIVANNLMPGEYSDWSRIKVTNSSSTKVKLYFYVTDLIGSACEGTALELKTGLHGGNEHAFTVFNSNIEEIKGIDNRVEITGHVFDPDMAVGAVAAVKLRAGISEDADNNSMGDSCSWTGVFVGEASTEDEVEPPVSFPVSFPEEEHSQD